MNGKPAVANKTKEFKYVLIALIILLGLIIFQYAKPYLSGFLGACTLYILLNGQMIFLTEKLKFGKYLSATIVTIESLLFFLIPLAGIVFLVIDTLSDVSIDPQALMDSITRFVNNLEDRIGFDLITTENLSALPKIGGNIVQVLGTSVYSMIINIIIIVFVLYFMLLNFKTLGRTVKEILPFKDENKQIVSEETRLIIQANAVGIPLLAIIQGIFAYMGYLFFGVENAILYAILTAFSTIIPIIGTTIVWLPIGVGYLIAGNTFGGLGILLYGLFIIGGVDNIARLLLQKKLADIHPLITVFGVLIGIPMFGFWGVIFGPLLLSLFILFFNMYRHEYIPGSNAEPRVTTRFKVKKVEIPGYIKKRSKKKNVPGIK